jgi:hypothetical protein
MSRNGGIHVTNTLCHLAVIASVMSMTIHAVNSGTVDLTPGLPLRLYDDPIIVRLCKDSVATNDPDAKGFNGRCASRMEPVHYGMPRGGLCRSRKAIEGQIMLSTLEDIPFAASCWCFRYLLVGEPFIYLCGRDLTTMCTTLGRWTVFGAVGASPLAAGRTAKCRARRGRERIIA